MAYIGIIKILKEEDTEKIFEDYNKYNLSKFDEDYKLTDIRKRFLKA